MLICVLPCQWAHTAIKMALNPSPTQNFKIGGVQANILPDKISIGVGQIRVCVKVTSQGGIQIMLFQIHA